MIVVANSSVLIALGSLGRLELLAQQFPDGIQVPSAVWREVVEAGGDRPGARAVADAKWIAVRGVKDDSRVRGFAQSLDEGEAEALALAVEISASVILLDEKDARHMAERLGFAPLGTVGLLIWARRTGRVASLRVELDSLRFKGKFRVSDSLYATALRAVGEE